MENAGQERRLARQGLQRLASLLRHGVGFTHNPQILVDAPQRHQTETVPLSNSLMSTADAAEYVFDGAAVMRE